MNKLLSLLSLLLISAGAWADHYTPESAYTQGDAVIYATVVTNETGATAASYEVGAFVDNLCIGAATPQTLSNGNVLYLIRARGNEDLVGKTIEFRAYNADKHTEYVLTPSETITFQLTGTYGYPSDLVTLTLKAPTSYALADIYIAVGETVNLLDFLTLTPADATLPLNTYWDLMPGNDNVYDEEGNLISEGGGNVGASINGNEMTGVEIGHGTYTLWSEGGDFLAEATYDVSIYATAINIVTETFDVKKNDVATLTRFMQNTWDAAQAYSLVPSDANDYVYWELTNDGIISETAEGWKPVQGGTTQIRPYFIDRNGNNVYPAGDKWITINVVVPVTSISFDIDNIYANVGDDIYDRLAAHVVILPEDATNKNFEFVVSYDSNITIDDNSAIVNQAGTGTIDVTCETEDDILFDVIQYRFYDPLKEVTFAEDPLSLEKNMDIYDEVEPLIANNIVGDESRIQNAQIDFSGVLTGSGSHTANGWNVHITNNELQKGIATVTVTLGWLDFTNNDDGTLVYGTPKSFTVNIGATLEYFTVTVTPDDSDPTKATITLTPEPSDADVNWEEFTPIVYPPDMFAEWGDAVYSITDNGDGTYDFTANLPGHYMFYDPSDFEDYSEYEVPMKVNFANGWQWKSNPYGNLYEPSEMEDFFGDNLEEVRTWQDLLINDPSWGYFGTLYDNGLGQDVMYKVKMNGAQTSYIYNGHNDIFYQQELAPGWNWIGSPFFFNRLLENAVLNDYYQIPTGMVIASKADGSAEWNGTAWVGDLTAIKKGEGYLVFNPETAETILDLAFEQYGNMLPGDEDGGNGSNGAPRHFTGPWHYDHTQFASNMTMVATVKDVNDDDRFSIGAFVKDECRGEGRFINGLAFITVHGNGGEQVTLKLYDNYTGEYYDIEQTVTSQTRLGSVSNPVQLSTTTVVTAITEIAADTDIQGTIYDADGRQLDNLQRGLNIVRLPDGTVRKVLKK